MLEMGIVVSLGLLVFYMRAGWKARLWINSHPFTIDVLVFVILNIVHWGTFSGVMVAAVGALFTSIAISVFRKLYGYVENGAYVPGIVDLREK